MGFDLRPKNAVQPRRQPGGHEPSHAPAVTIYLVIASCLVSSAGLVLSMIMVSAGTRPARWYVFALTLCGALAVGVLAVDPVSHLNNAYRGWLSGTR